MVKGVIMSRLTLALLLGIGALALVGLRPALAQDSPPSPAGPQSTIPAQRIPLNICANPEALPYTSDDATTPGFQLELYRAVVEALGRQNSVTWVYNRIAARYANCGGWMSRIVTTNMHATRGQQLTAPYMGTGLVIVRKAGASSHFENLPALLAEPEFRKGARVGIPVGAWIGSIVERNGVETAGYRGQLDIIEAVLSGEIAAGIVRREDVGWYQREHPGSLAVIEMYKYDPDFRWNIAMGLRKSTPELLAQINGVLEQLRSDGKLREITQKYGFAYIPPYPGN